MNGLPPALTLVVVFSLCTSLALAFALFSSLKRLRKYRDSSDIGTTIDTAKGIEEADRKMLKSALEFGDMIAREVMVPRTDMITLSDDETYGSALKLFIRSGFSRIPVLGDSADEVLGVAYFKDLVEAIHIKSASEKEPIKTLVREVMFVPETKPVDDLFRSMQEERQHIALVIDEYGGVAGLVTLEDTLEEIVGELDDEHDSTAEEDLELVYTDDAQVASCLLPARYLISDLEELFGVQIEHDDVDTVLGLLTREIGKVAIKGSHASISGLELKAEGTSGRRKHITSVRVTRSTPSEAEV
ncbi:MAG: hemolysin family protein [Candidatus Ancillula sp.]|jgi:CBS domain containing-hemolysin-like protein|nr:hemolysin family protein [Candidatus Ancillula sp.]